MWERVGCMQVFLEPSEPTEDHNLFPLPNFWALIFLCFLGSAFRISELTKLIPYTHINQPYSFSIKVALCGLVGMREA